MCDVTNPRPAQPPYYSVVAQRVVVFLDWQNVYKRARGAFCRETDDNVEGQVDPVALAKLLTTRTTGRELTQVRIYRGLPTNKNDPQGYAANRRHTAAWMRLRPQPHVYLRPLQYIEGLAPREKGIDVRLAIDLTMMAVYKRYDVGILCSSDTDLAPALEAVYDLAGKQGGPVAEVASWDGPNTRRKRINAAGDRNVWCHWLDEDAYGAVQDRTNYARG